MITLFSSAQALYNQMIEEEWQKNGEWYCHCVHQQEST